MHSVGGGSPHFATEVPFHRNGRQMAYPRRARREDAIKIDGACLRFSDTHRPRDLWFYRWRIKSPGCRPIRPSLLLICGAVFSNSRRAVRSTRIMAASWSTSGRAGADPGLTARAAKVRFGSWREELAVSISRPLFPNDRKSKPISIASGSGQLRTHAPHNSRGGLVRQVRG